MKKILRMCIFFIAIFLLAINIKVDASQVGVYDNADLFSNSEKQSLENKISDLSNKYKIDIMIVSIKDAKGKSDKSYAQDFYESNRKSYDSENSGILLLIDMKERYLYIDTQGKCIKYFTDERLNKIEDHIYKELGNGNYAEAGNNFLNDVATYLEAGIPSNQYDYDEVKVLKDKRIKIVLIGLSAALIIPAIICLIIVKSYGSPKSESVRIYIKENTLKFLSKKDQFVTSHLTKTKIPKNDNSGGNNPGRSTIHTSSSGEKHGGGGRHF